MIKFCVFSGNFQQNQESWHLGFILHANSSNQKLNLHSYLLPFGFWLPSRGACSSSVELIARRVALEDGIRFLDEKKEGKGLIYRYSKFSLTKKETKLSFQKDKFMSVIPRDSFQFKPCLSLN